MAAPRVDISPDKQALKAGCKALVRAGGGVESGISRVGKSLLSEYGRPDNECFMPLDVVADFEDATHGTAGHPIVTRLLAKRQGYALVRLPSAALPTGEALYSALAASVTDSGELHAGIARALSDGTVSVAEADMIQRLAIDAAEEAMRLAAIAAQIREMQ